MRWLFAETDDERRQREHVIAQIDAWWRAFSTRAGEIAGFFDRGNDMDLPRFMAERLQAIDAGLMWEFGPAVEGRGHRLVVTPESERSLEPLVDELLARAPSLDGWEFVKFRVACPIEEALATVLGRTAFDVRDRRFRVARDGRRIDLIFLVPRRGPRDDVAAEVAYVAAESLLGEAFLGRWIGSIDVQTLPSFAGVSGFGRRATVLELHALRAICDDLAQEIRDTLPTQPHFQLDGAPTGFVYELEPQRADDYPRTGDMFVGKGTIPGLFEATRSSPFESSTWSRCGETFCYVKLDGSEGVHEEGFADKAEIEDALDEALREAACGCFIGGGTGLRYSYVDLAVTDIAQAVAVVRDVLRRGKVPLRTWLLFHDSHLADEWVGIYQDTPAPPS